MVRLYSEEHLSSNKIAQIYQTSHSVIISYLRGRGVTIRYSSSAHLGVMPKGFNDEQYLRKLYWDFNLSCKDIGKRLGINATTVRRQLNRLGIPTRTNSESKIGLNTGDSHPQWRGGITPLNNSLRGYFNNHLVPVALQRDNYTCQCCGAVDTVLHIHHIIPLASIVKDICLEHPRYNPNDVKDKAQLYEIITHDDRFLDIDNLITLCECCHYIGAHQYNRSKTISSQASIEEGSETIP